MKILVTGTAGFIGHHLSKRLLERGDEVFGLDNINDYYDQRLKYGRLKESGIGAEDIEWNKTITSKKYPNYRFVRMNLEDQKGVMNLYAEEKFDAVVNLAAQAGVRYSLSNPLAYMEANVIGFLSILEACRKYPVKHCVYASSSSVYGLNDTMPFSTTQNVDRPISLYAASKKSNELMAHTYSHLFQIPTTGLRFFTVYGPWGRPDMALYIFTKSILEGKPIDVYNHGQMKRDFTYVDDIVEGVIRVMDKPACTETNGKCPYRISNIGNSSPVLLMDFIKAIEDNVGKKANINYMPIQAGDVPATWADVSDLAKEFDYQPATEIQTGVKNFVSWYRDFHAC